VDGTFAENSPAPTESRAEQVGQRLDEIAAGGVPATLTGLVGVPARHRLALAARDEPQGRVSATTLTGGTATEPWDGAGVTTTAQPVTVAELQAGLRAVWAGQFRTQSGRGSLRARRTQREPGTALSGRVVMVVGCHGGAGASTLALAVAQAALASGRSARLLDCASPQRSGLLTAVDAELGVDGSGWRRGRRARLPIDRLCDVLSSPTDVPAPPEQPPGGAEVTVVDTGWGVADVLAGDSWLAQEAGSAAMVLVARATIPALRQLEQGLATCPGDPVVAVLGPTRWARSVHATAGRLLKAAESAGRVVIVPVDRHLSAAGITCAPLPKAVLEAGRQIIARVLAADSDPGSAEHRPPGLSPTCVSNTADANRADANRADANRADANRADANRADANRADANRAVANRAVANSDEMDREHDHRTD
jgi:hypothetical protein